MNRYYSGNPGFGFNHVGFNRCAAPRQMSAISNNTNSNDQKSRESRLFVGNLNPDSLTQEKLEEIFSLHGQIIGISLHKGYAFVQYASKEEARQACRMEQGRVLNFQPMDINIVSDPNPNRAKGFKRVQNPAYYNGSGYVDPATLPLITATGQAGPPAAKKVRRFVETSQMDTEGDEPSSWTCAYCKEEIPTCWGLMKHVATTHQTRIYMEDSEKVSA